MTTNENVERYSKTKRTVSTGGIRTRLNHIFQSLAGLQKVSEIGQGSG